MNIGERIKKYRKKAGLSQKKLGEKLGVSQQHIAQYESGKRTPKIETINTIAEALDVSVRELYPEFSYEEWKTTETYKTSRAKYDLSIRGIVALLSYNMSGVREEYIDTGTAKGYLYYIEKGGEREYISHETLGQMHYFLINMMPTLYELVEKIPVPSLDELKRQLQEYRKKYNPQYKECQDDPPEK